MRLAWFSPMPPVRSGIAACSAELVAALGARHEIDVFVDEPVAAAAPATCSAHEFLPRHRRSPYDLTVYQLGNASHHDYLWPYLFRFPGLTVLHDPQLHHARAAALLHRRRPHDYRREFAANHPDAPPDAAELAVAGFDSHLYYLWPMIRLVVNASRLTAVHSREIADQLRSDLGNDRVEYLRLSHGTPLTDEQEQAARQKVRRQYGIHPDAVTFGCFGGLTPEKRLPQVLEAFAAVLPYAPDARLLLAGAGAAHYELEADVRSRGLADLVVITGYLQSDDELTAAIAAVDVTLNLRWPTAREISGPWLRALAAGKPTIVTDLLQTAGVPSLDPRSWTMSSGGEPGRKPVTVAIDMMDEDHSLRLAMRRLAGDPALRRSLGDAAREYWQREHAPELMSADYDRVMLLARSQRTSSSPLPAHLTDDGTRWMETLLAPFGIAPPVNSIQA